MRNKYFRNGLSLFLSVLIGLQSVSSWGLTLNEQEKEFFQTQTGSHLKAMFPKIAKPEDLLKAAIKANIQRHDIKDLKGPKQPQEITKIMNRITPMLQREINTRTTHKAFYNGYSNELDLYIGILKEFVQFSNLSDANSTHPLRFKLPSNIKNVNEFLNNFTKAYLDEAKARKVKPYNPTRNSGFTFAPDLTPFAREHMMSVNTSMFGNINTLGEDTFYYFLNSFSIGHPNDALIRKLLVQTGIGSKSPVQLQAQIDAYKSFFTDKMKNAGGGLMQILVRNCDIDRIGYACYAKGVPFYMNKKTGQFATRGSNKRSLPLLVNGTNDLERPSLNNMLNLYKQDAHEFAKKFSHANLGGFYSMDRFQARLVINPTDFTDPKVVQVFRTFRQQPAKADIDAVSTKTRNKLKVDIFNAIKNNTLTTMFYDSGFNIGKLERYLRGKGKVTANDLIEIVKKTSKAVMQEILNGLQVIAKKISSAVVTRFDALKSWVNKWNSAGRKMNWATSFIWSEIRKAFA